MISLSELCYTFQLSFTSTFLLSIFVASYFTLNTVKHVLFHDMSTLFVPFILCHNRLYAIYSFLVLTDLHTSDSTSHEMQHFVPFHVVPLVLQYMFSTTASFAQRLDPMLTKYCFSHSIVKVYSFLFWEENTPSQGFLLLLPSLSS